MTSTRRQFLAGILVTSGLLLTSIPLVRRSPNSVTWVTQLDDRVRPGHDGPLWDDAYNREQLERMRRSFEELGDACRTATESFQRMPCIMIDLVDPDQPPFGRMTVLDESESDGTA